MIKDIFYGNWITYGTEIMSLYHLHKTCTGDFAVNSNIFLEGPRLLVAPPFQLVFVF